jgi:di/tricarboxylate transporter
MSLLSFFSTPAVTTFEQLELEKGKIQLTIMKMAASILGIIMLAVVFIFLVGLFIPNELIDNNEIFKIIGPAFSTIVGAFVGAFATMMGMKVSELDTNVKTQELGKTDHKAVAEAHVINAQAESIETENEIKMMAAVDKYKNSDEDYGPF